MENINKLITVASKYDDTVIKISKEFINELKVGCRTYGEVYEKLEIFIRETRWSNSKAVSLTILIPCIKEMLEKEKNDLLLTNRSE